MLQQIRLDDVLARDIEVPWMEGVALVQAVCRQVLDGSSSAGGFPSAAGIILDAAGTVGIVAGASADDPVTSAAHLLARMSGDDVPVRLRLLVTQATGAGHVYPTLGEFSEALAYFERPDGQELIRELFRRAALAPVRAVAPPAEHTAAPVHHGPREDPERRRPRRSPALVLAPVIALACAGAAWLVGPWSGTARALSELSIIASSGRRETAPSSPSPRTTGPVREPAGPRAPHRAGGQGLLPARRPSKPLDVPQLHPIVEGEVAWVPSIATPALSATPSAADASPMVFYSSVEVTAIPPPGRVETRAEPDQGRIYTRSDAGVVPPRAIYPKLPDGPPEGPVGNQAVLDLVIATSGAVEHVELRTTPHHIHEFMLVSAAKAWQFEPARFEGRPVRFRQRVYIPLQ